MGDRRSEAPKHIECMGCVQRLVRPYVEPYGIPPYIVWYRKVKGKR
nr:MAG TPA: hypothetical protein [Caudoviricetes sp.]